MYFVLYSHYKTKGMCEGGIKKYLRPLKFYRAGTPPPSFEIPGSATDGDVSKRVNSSGVGRKTSNKQPTHWPTRPQYPCIGHLEDPCSQLLQRVWLYIIYWLLCYTYSIDCGMSRRRFKHWTFHMQGKTLYRCILPLLCGTGPRTSALWWPGRTGFYDATDGAPLT